MFNAVSMALSRVKFGIPYEILQLAFGGGMTANPFGNSNIDETIINNVFKAKLFQDCNLMGGKTIQVLLQQSWHEKTSFNALDMNSSNGFFSLYRIPFAATDGRPIVEVHHIQAPSPYMMDPGIQDPLRGCILGGFVNDVLDSRTAGDISRRPIPELLQGNMLRLHPGGMSHVDWVLTCRVAYDENMSNLNGSAIDSFADLAVMATKMYIYNTLIIKIDRGYIQGGAELSTIKSIVEQWGNLDADYKNRLNEYFGGNAMDIQRIGPLLKYIIP